MSVINKMMKDLDQRGAAPPRVKIPLESVQSMRHTAHASWAGKAGWFLLALVAMVGAWYGYTSWTKAPAVAPQISPSLPQQPAVVAPKTSPVVVAEVSRTPETLKSEAQPIPKPGPESAAPTPSAEAVALKASKEETAARKKSEAEAAALKEREAEAAALKEREAKAAALKAREAEAVALKESEAKAAAMKAREAEATALKEREAKAAALKAREAEAVALKESEAKAAALKAREAEATALKEREAKAAVANEATAAAAKEAKAAAAKEAKAAALKEREAKAAAAKEAKATALKEREAKAALKLASERVAVAQKPAVVIPETAPRQQPLAVTAQAPAARPASPPTQSEGTISIERQNKPLSQTDQVTTEYRGAVDLMKQGRADLAIDAFARTLRLDPRHVAARQSMVSLLMERGRLPELQSALREGLAVVPENASWAMLLARAQVETRDAAGALDTLEKALPYAKNRPDYHAFVGTVLQMLSRHNEAIAHYEIAVRMVPESGRWLTGLGISLSEEKRYSEARTAFRRALATSTLGEDLQVFVERKLNQIQALGDAK